MTAFDPDDYVGIATSQVASIAQEAHASIDQRRWNGEPYFVHPARVAIAAAQAGLPDVAIQAALLHDVVEDTPVSLVELAARGVAPAVLVLVDALTRRPGEPYSEYVGRIVEHPLAASLKLLDMADNSADPVAPEREQAHTAMMAKRATWRERLLEAAQGGRP